MDSSKQPNIWSNPVHFLAFGLGSGLSPKAPGTVGTLAAIPFYLLLCHLSLPYYLLFVVVASIIGIGLCGKTAADIGVHDHSGIVWDEFCGFWVTMAAAPPGWLWIIYGFIIFRLFDILKPWPINYLDQFVLGGTGIMLDDIIAGLFSLLLLQSTFLLLTL